MKGLPYFGGKQSKLPWLLPLINKPCATYVEPFCGGLAVLLARPPATCEIVNDADGQVINFWREVQKDAAAVIKANERILYHPQEYAEAKRIYAAKERGTRAAAFFLFNSYASFSHIICGSYRANFGQAMPTTMEGMRKTLPAIMARIRHVQFVQKDIGDFLSQLEININCTKPPVLLYADPPYLEAEPQYQLGMPVFSHRASCRQYRTLAEKGWLIAVSNYANEVYDNGLAGWERHVLETRATTNNGANTDRQEVLWTSWKESK